MNNAITALERYLNSQPKLELAYVFGSVAKGLATPESDLDIAVRSNHILSVEERVVLVGELALISGRAVDLVDLKTVGEPVLGEILAQGIRLKGSNNLHAELINKHLLNVADFLPYVSRMLAERRAQWLA